MSLYIKLLAKSIISKKGFIELNRNPEYVSAVRQIENLICTHRESLLGSSAWRTDFLKELQSRPFYMLRKGAAACYFYDCGVAGSGWDEERCQACGRTSQRPEYQIHLFGPIYQASKIWESNWIDIVPKLILLWKSSSFIDDGLLKPYQGKNPSRSPSETKSTKKKGAYLDDDLKNDEAERLSIVNQSLDKGSPIILDENEGRKEIRQIEPKKLNWWEKKFPKLMNADPETNWQLSV